MLCSCALGIFLALILLRIAYRFYRSTREKTKLKNLSGKSVLITGCDSGFGHWLALKLAGEQIKGMIHILRHILRLHLYKLSSRKEMVSQNATQFTNDPKVFAGCLTKNGQEELTSKRSQRILEFLEPFPLDVTSTQSVNDALPLVFEKQKDHQLWAIVNNAGIAGKGMPDDFLDEEDYRKVLEVNFYGILRLCHAFKPLLKKSKGRIVNCASLAGRMVSPGLGPYCVSKHMVEIYSDILRYELKHFNVSVHIIEPSAFRTPIVTPVLTDETMDKYWTGATPELRDEYGQEYFDKWKQRLRAVFDKGADPDYMKVVEAYFHAITSAHPRERYRVGKSAEIMTPITTLPLWIQDIILRVLRGKRDDMIPKICQGN